MMKFWLIADDSRIVAIISFAPNDGVDGREGGQRPLLVPPGRFSRQIQEYRPLSLNAEAGEEYSMQSLPSKRGIKKIL